MKKLNPIFLISAVFAIVLMTTACSNTFEGIGKDIEKMGKDIQGES